MKLWGEFCVSDSFSAKSSKSDIQEAWNTRISNDPLLQQWFRNLWMKNECLTSK
jgi:hypothetical protein